MTTPATPIRCDAIVDAGSRPCDLTPDCVGRMRAQASPLRPFLAQWACAKCGQRRAASDVELAGLP